MQIIATGLSGTIGRKLSSSVMPAKIRLGQEKLSKYFDMRGEPIQLIHLAGIVGERKVTTDLTYSELINVEETLNLATEIIENNGGRFIHISSSHIYGPQQVRIKEESNFNPQTMYAEQKLRAELLLQERFGKENPSLLILRIFSVLGWDVENFTLGGAIKRILEGSVEKISCTDDVRDFMTPTTIAKSIEEIAQNKSISGIYNLCTGVGITVAEASRSMFEISGEYINYDVLLPGYSAAPRIVGDNSKIMNSIPTLNLTWNPLEDLNQNTGVSNW